MTTPKKPIQARLQLVALNGELIELRTNALAPLRRRMHRKKVIRAQVFAFAPKSHQERGPMFARDGGPLFPLLDPINRLPDVGRHFSERAPRIKDPVKRCHGEHNASDELSGQGPPMIPMTKIAPQRTISPMGRGVTPIKFRAEMAKRLSSARVVAGYQTKKEAADALGVGLDRYEKWENGRTPVPAQYVAPVCELFGIDANYLFGISHAQRKVASQ